MSPSIKDVNAIDRTLNSYLGHLTGVSEPASHEAAAAATAHEVLVRLYPNFSNRWHKSRTAAVLLNDDGRAHALVVDTAKIITVEFERAGFFRHQAHARRFSRFQIGAQPKVGNVEAMRHVL